MTTTRLSRTQMLSLLLAAIVAFSATAGVAGIASAATTTDLTVSITDDDNTIAPGETTTVELAIANASGGVGAAELGVELSDSGTANIKDVTILHDPGLKNTTIAGDKQSADLDWGLANSPDTGSVIIVEVTLQATGPGSTDINVVKNSQTGSLVVFDEIGAGYTLDTVGSATLTVETPNQPPNADAGPNQTVNPGTTVTLDGSGSSDPDGDSLTYNWTQTGGPPISLSDPTAEQPTFQVPGIPLPLNYTFELEVADGNGGTDTDTITVTAKPGSVNDPPNADAGPDQGVDEGDMVTLDASGSSDPNGDTLSYTWTQTDGPSVSLSDATAEQPTFTAPDVDNETTLTFEVEVSDGEKTDTDTVTVTVSDIAAITSDLTVSITDDDNTIASGETTTVKLAVANASGGVGAAELGVELSNSSVATITDATVLHNPGSETKTVNGNSADFEWATADSPDTGSVTIVEITLQAAAPGSTDINVVENSLTGNLVVFNEEGTGYTFDTVGSATLMVVKPNQPPNADASDDQSVDEGDSVELNASGSSDPDGDALSYTWTQTAGPSVSLSDATAEQPTFTAPDVNTQTTLTFEVEVSDGNGGTDTDTVNVTVSDLVATTTDLTVSITDDDNTIASGETTTVKIAVANASGGVGAAELGVELSNSGVATITGATILHNPGTETKTVNGQSADFEWATADSPDTGSVTIVEITLQAAAPGSTDINVVENSLTGNLVVFDENGAGYTLDTVGSATLMVVKPNQPPNADAGDDQSVDEGDSVTLDASGSSDPNGDALTYMWTQTDGPSVSLSDASAAQPTFTAPSQVSEPTTLTFEVEVSDGELNDTDTVTVTVQPVNDPPVADAGDDQSVDEGASVTLDASGSSDPNGDALTYMWTQTGGPSVSLSDASAAQPSFTAPSQVSEPTTLTFEVKVSDGELNDTDTVNVTVQPVNDAPNADAGDDQNVDEGDSVTLDASGSSDPDGDMLSYHWTQTSGPSVTLSDASAEQPMFTAPTVTEETTLTFEVKVSDGELNDTDTVTVTVQPVNDPPMADAGDDQSVDEGTQVALDASGSSDPDGDMLSYHWTQTGGPSVSLSDATAEQPTFTAPTVTEETTLTFEVEVSDGELNDTDTVTVTVQPVNDPPMADAGDDQSVDEGTQVALDASGSSDPNGDALSYMWTQTGGPSVSLTDASAAQPTFTAPSQVNEPTTLTFEVEVSDGELNDTDTVNVTVQPVNDPPMADAGDDQSVDEGASVELNASGSSDPDGDTLTYSWTVVDDAGTGVSLMDNNTATPSFTAPSQVSEPTTLTFEVEVSDGELNDTDTVTVTVQPLNDPPMADAGDDQSVDEDDSVTLDATGSSDPDGDMLNYSWSQIGGPSVSLQNADTDSPTFTAPLVENDTILTFEVEVTDKAGATASDTVNVTVNDTGTGAISIRLVGADKNAEIAATKTNTYQVIVDGVDNGIGAFTVTVSSENTSVATITNANIQAASTSDGSGLTSVNVSNSSATLEAALRDTNDTGSVVIGNLTVTGQATGSVDIGVSVGTIGDEDGQPYAVASETGASLDVIELNKVDPQFEGVPDDLDDDGKYEDITGDGEFTIQDIQALWANRNSRTITDFVEVYDFNNDGEFSVLDVQALWRQLVG